jgi:hypothetical protein
MKTIPTLTFLAALVAFALLPHTLAIAGSLLFGASFLSMFAIDCTRTIKPLEARASVVNFPRPTRRAPAFELAA